MDWGNVPYKDFPPGWGHLMIPIHSRAAALAGLSLFTPCTGRSVWTHRAAWFATRILGHHALLGRVSYWNNPFAETTTKLLTNRLVKSIGVFDSIAGYQRLQPGRQGLTLLLLNRSKAVGFLKLREGDSESLHREYEALTMLALSKPRTFSTPSVIDYGSIQEWHFLLTTALPSAPHRVPHAPAIRQIVTEIETALSTMHRPTSISDTWRPMHGDLTPWNLRRLRNGRLTLFDWEETSWGPEGADEVLYRATEAALSGRKASPSRATEAIWFWRTLFTERPDRTKRDIRLKASVLKALAEMEL